MNVLVTPIGDQDPLSEKTNERGSVLTLADHLQHAFDRVFLLYARHPSGEDSRVYVDASGNKRSLRLDYHALAEETRDALRADAPRISRDAVTLLPLVMANPADYRQAFTAAEQAARIIMQTLTAEGNPYTLYVSAASGTPALKAAMILLVSSGLLATSDGPPPTVYQVADPRYVDADAGRVTTVDVTLIEAVRLISHSCDLLDAETLEAARENLQRLAKIAYSLARRQLAAALDRYVAALQTHQRLAYAQAEREMSNLLPDPLTDPATSAPLGGIHRLIGQQIDTLRAAADPGNRTALLHDLLLNAERRQRHGEYADALARCWRVVDEALWWRLKNQHGIGRDVRLSPDQRDMLTQNSSDEKLKERVLGPDGPKLPLYVEHVVEILHALHDTGITRALEMPLDAELGSQARERIDEQPKKLRDDLKRRLRNNRSSTGDRFAMKTYDDLLAWVNFMRNHSVVGHGHADVADVDGAAAAALARHIVTAVAGAPATDHPFGLSEYRRFTQWARGALT